MAYMNQLKKSEINAELKKIIPKSWRWSLSVKHHSTLVFTLSSAPAAELGEFDGKHVQINHYYPEKYFKGPILELVERIIKAINFKNYNRSDCYTDYYDVGYFVNFSIGRWDKFFTASV